jgi:hypothetical protein
MIIQLKRAVNGGTRVIISIENLEPIIVYDLKRKRSPKTNPTNPERESHIQLSLLAFCGTNDPRLTRLNKLRKINPIVNRRIFTDTDPIFRLADSNDREVTVQKMAVSKAANSPR